MLLEHVQTLEKEIKLAHADVVRNVVKLQKKVKQLQTALIFVAAILVLVIVAG